MGPIVYHPDANTTAYQRYQTKRYGDYALAVIAEGRIPALRKSTSATRLAQPISSPMSSRAWSRSSEAYRSQAMVLTKSC